MPGFNDYPTGYCEAFGGEALFGATASHCREINGCTAANCPLETAGRRPDMDIAAKFLGGPFALMMLGRGPLRTR
jgi:hypothetical protein